MIKSDSLAKLAPALLAAQKNMGAALKDSKNPFFKSKYADLNAVIDASIPALNDQGIAVLQTPALALNPLNGEQTPVIETVFLHESGEYLVGQSEIVAAKANDPQAHGSATTYARRYGLQAMATLKAEDDDGETAMGRKSATTSPTEKYKPSAAPVKTESPKAEASVKEETPAAKPAPFRRTRAQSLPTDNSDVL